MLLDQNGSQIGVIPDVELLFGENDLDGKWAGEFAKPCPAGKRPRLQRKTWRRVQMVDAYLRSVYPTLAVWLVTHQNVFANYPPEAYPDDLDLA